MKRPMIGQLAGHAVPRSAQRRLPRWPILDSRAHSPLSWRDPTAVKTTLSRARTLIGRLQEEIPYMKYLIDGYNLLHALGLLRTRAGPGHLLKARLGLMRFLATGGIDWLCRSAAGRLKIRNPKHQIRNKFEAQRTE